MNLLLRIILFTVLVVLSVKTLQIIHTKYFHPGLYPSTTSVVKMPPKASDSVIRHTKPIVKPKVGRRCK